ncbi:restriction endonuclease subunit S [bacterium]|nr:restriction endonuclease subunit S [bacterium]
MTSNGWQRVPLGEVLTRSDETTEIIPTERYTQVTVRLWGKGVVPRGEVGGLEVASGRRFLVRKGQFILSRIDARHGAFGIVPDELDGAIATNDFPTFEVNETSASRSFLSWLSRTQDFVHLCRRASEGTTNRVRLKEDRFLDMPIPLPDRKEQDRIVAKLDALSARIDEARELFSQSQVECMSLVTSLHHSLAGDRVLRVSDFLRLEEERVPVEAAGEYPQVGIRSFGGGLFPKESVLGLDTTYKHFNRLSADMVVLSQVKGWEGAIAVCPAELAGRYASPEYRTFRCIEDAALPEYMATLVRTDWFHGLLATATRGQGARRERTRPEMFLDIELPMPDIEKQAQAVEVFKRLWAMSPIYADSATELDALLPSALDKAFKGEL